MLVLPHDLNQVVKDLSFPYLSTHIFMLSAKLLSLLDKLS
jgi:hypothetical protein